MAASPAPDSPLAARFDLRPQIAALGREAAIFAAFLLLAVILTWPMAAQLGTIVSDNGDPLLNAWILDWDCFALVRHPLSVYQAPMFYPARYPLAYSENLLGIALVVLPLSLMHVPPLTIYNVAMLLGFAFSAYGAFVLARLATRSTLAAAVAGILYGFVQFRFDHLAHLQVTWGGWLPLIAAALLYFRSSPSLGRAALLCGALIMNGLTNVHWLLFGFVAFGVTLLFLAAAGDAARGLRFWALLLGAAAVSVLVLIPVLRPYKRVSELYNMHRAPEEVGPNSATWNDWLVATPRNALYGSLASVEASKHERRLFPGLVVLFLSAAALLTYRREEFDVVPRRWPRAPRWLVRIIDVMIVTLAALSYFGAVAPRYVWTFQGHQILALKGSDIPMLLLLVAVLLRLALRLPDAVAGREGAALVDAVRDGRFPPAFWIGMLWIAIGVLGSFGLNGFFHTFLYGRVQAFQSLRVPARWAMIAYVGLSLTAAYGVVALTRMRDRRWRTAIAAAIILFALNDVRTRILWDQAIPGIAPVYRWIARTDFPGAILELPIDHDSAFQYLLSATAHHKPLMNGTSGFEPPLHRRLRELIEQKAISDEFVWKLIENRCALVVVHADLLGDQSSQVRDWLRRELRPGRLAFLRRFENQVNGDWLFAVTPVLSDWQRLRAPEVPDAAGYTPSQNLGRMLSDQPTYSASTFGLLERPHNWEEPHGPLQVSGWALSQYGVREVILRFDAGRKQFRADFTPRPDIEAMYPWYPQAPIAGFTRTFARRPAGLPRETDLQIEIVDGRGERTRLPNLFVPWH